MTKFNVGDNVRFSPAEVGWELEDIATELEELKRFFESFVWGADEHADECHSLRESRQFQLMERRSLLTGGPYKIVSIRPGEDDWSWITLAEDPVEWWGYVFELAK